VEKKRERRNKICAWLIGIGLVLMAVHNVDQPLLKYAFLPVIGMSLIVPAMLLALSENRHNITLGSKWVWIPMVIIALSISLSGELSIFNIILGGVLFGLYLSARILGQRLFKPFAFAIVIETISLIWYGFEHIGDNQGGIISWTNYDIATGFLLFGLVFSSIKHQWWLSGIALAGLYLTGAEEAVFAILVLLAVVLIRRDWGYKILFPIVTMVLFIPFSYTFDIPQGLYGGMVDKLPIIGQSATAQANTEIWVRDREVEAQTNGEETWIHPIKNYTWEDVLDQMSGYRWYDWKNALTDIKVFGHGYNMTNFYWGIPHNVPLVIVWQVGILAALSWLFVMVYLLIKTKWKYAIITILALSVFDHFIWTQIGMWWWAAVGVISLNDIKSDLVFKE
jgi:hypothetical protein